jgi:D-3-phosphoglycerate dehydrogenase
MKVLVTDGLSPRGVELLRGRGLAVDARPSLPAEELLRAVVDADGLIVRSATAVDVKVLEAGRKLKVVGRAGVGVDNIDVETATGRGVVVMNTPGGNTVSAAEHTFSLLLAVAKHVPQAAASLKSGRWEKHRFRSVELCGKVLGVIGLGRIGSEVARRARAFEMHVIAYDPFVASEVAENLGVRLVELPELFRQADFLTVHVPRSPATDGLIGREAIAQMKRGVRIVNCARGGIVDEAALAEALRDGQVAGAALDVFEREPLGESPLLGLEGFIGTPHLGAASEEAQESVAVAIATQVADFLTRGVVQNAVNAPSIPPELLKKVQPYLSLAEKLGRLGAQLAEGRMQAIQIDYQGEVAGFDCTPLTVSVVKGVLEPVLEEGVNLVNAMTVARRRGIRVVERRVSEGGDFASLISVGLRTDRGESVVAGTLFSQRDPRLVRINEFRLEAVPEGYLLVFSNQDVPGVIGRIGTLLGQNQVNIAGMQLGRERPGGRAVSVVNVDGPIPERVLAQIRQFPDIVYAKLVKV